MLSAVAPMARSGSNDDRDDPRRARLSDRREQDDHHVGREDEAHIVERVGNAA